jgi:hypothetical protein
LMEYIVTNCPKKQKLLFHLPINAFFCLSEFTFSYDNKRLWI